MAYTSYKASAPGSFMISGEHAVLRGKLALVAAVDKRMTVCLTPRSDQTVLIKSARLGEYKAQLSQITSEPPFEFVLTSIAEYQSILPSGFELTIEADFSHKVGLSSSAAVTVATIAVLSKFSGKTLTEREYFLKACKVIQQVQGLGSGADVAASVYGGVLAYTRDPLDIEIVEHYPKLHLIYSGYKTSTPDVVAQVDERVKKHTPFYRAIFNAIHAASEALKEAFTEKNSLSIGQWFNRHYALQDAMQLACPSIKKIVRELRAMPSILGVKISGAGLGDCVLAVGELNPDTLPGQLTIKVSSTGLLLDE